MLYLNSDFASATNFVKGRYFRGTLRFKFTKKTYYVINSDLYNNNAYKSSFNIDR